jgi:ubiquitin-activating enzyme E1
MKNIQKLIEIIAKNNFEKILKRSVDIHHENYIFQIKKLIEEFPTNFINNDGSLFWSGSKRLPEIIKYNTNDIDCFNFIKYYSIIFTRSTNVKINNDENYIRTIFEKLDIPEYKKETKILTREEELKKISNLKTFLYNFD